MVHLAWSSPSLSSLSMASRGEDIPGNLNVYVADVAVDLSGAIHCLIADVSILPEPAIRRPDVAVYLHRPWRDFVSLIVVTLLKR